MPNLLFITRDKSFSVEIPLTWIEHKYYAKETECKNGVNRAFAEIERLGECIKAEQLEKGKVLEEMQAHIDCLKAELAEAQLNKINLPSEPIEAAAYLINHTFTYNGLLGKEQECRTYDVSALRQIAEHLLVHCNNADE